MGNLFWYGRLKITPEAGLTNRTRQTFGLGSDHNVSTKFVSGRPSVRTGPDRYQIKRPDHGVHAKSPPNRISRRSWFSSESDVYSDFLPFKLKIKYRTVNIVLWSSNREFYIRKHKPRNDSCRKRGVSARSKTPFICQKSHKTDMFDDDDDEY